MIKTSKYKLKEGAQSAGKEFKFEDTERIKIERAAFDAKEVEYYEKDRPFNDQERRFEYYRKLNPKSYIQHVRSVMRLLDERDVKEYIVIYVIKECKQIIVDEEGRRIQKPHTIEGWWGYYDDPVVEPLEFNLDGSVKKAGVSRFERRYYIPWSKEKLMEIINDPANRSTTTQFYLGLASQDPSSDNAQMGTVYLIRNAQDFANHSFEDVLKLARSRLSGTEESMSTIKQTLELRKRLGTPVKDVVVKPNVEGSKTDLTENKPKP